MSPFAKYVFITCSPFLLVFQSLSLAAADRGPIWERHTIDDSSAGADGVRLADVNGDGLMDVATGWEEGDQTRMYLNPGYKNAKRLWPSVTVGVTPNVEDAVFVDLDGDGASEVISCCEGKTQSILINWAPTNAKRLLDSKAWKTEAIPASVGLTRWMFALPFQIDGENGLDLFVSSKDPNGLVGWFQAPKNPRDLSAWKFHKLYDAGWIMSLKLHDLDQDGDKDLIVSDRKGDNSGVLWLENPGPSNATSKPWNEHRIGGASDEVMFLDVADIDGDGSLEIACPVKPHQIKIFEARKDVTSLWTESVIDISIPSGLGPAKASTIGDIDNDGQLDLVYSCESAFPPLQGIIWLKQDKGKWRTQNLGGPTGIKFDRIELLDMDGDGDLDALTCEERHEKKGLGIIWYENPN